MGNLKTRPRKTVDDYMKLPEGTRAELIEGEIFMSPSPKYRHQKTASKLHFLLHRFVEPPGLGEIFTAPFDVHLPSGDIVQPDLIFVARENLDIVRDWIYGAPDLLVEIVSPENPARDRIVKRDLYAKNGVKEYWIADPDTRSVEVFALAGERYEPAGYFEEADTLASPLLAGLALPVREVFA